MLLKVYLFYLTWLFIRRKQKSVPDPVESYVVVSVHVNASNQTCVLQEFVSVF